MLIVVRLCRRGAGADVADSDASAPIELTCNDNVVITQQQNGDGITAITKCFRASNDDVAARIQCGRQDENIIFCEYTNNI
jgi:hypothetical protein